MTADAAAGGRSGWLAAPLLLLVVAWNLRTVLAIVGTSAARIEADLGSGGAVTGAVSTVFVLGAALAAPLAGAASRRWSPWLVALLGLASISLAHGLLWLGDVRWIWLAVGIGGLGGGLIGAMTPALVAVLLPARAGLGVAMFMVGGSLGFYAASAAVAWAGVRGLPWTAASGLLGMVTLSCALAWLFAPSARRARVRTPSRGGVTSGTVAGRPVPGWMWVLVAFLSVQSLSVFAIIAWVAPSVEAVGASATTSATMLGLFSALQVVSGVGLPLVAQRWQLSGACVAASAASVLGGTVLFAAGAVEQGHLGLGWPAVGLMALGHGGAFAMANYLVATLAGSQDDAIRFGSLMMLWSQLAGASGPLLFGLARDQLGGYSAVWWLLGGIGLAMTVGAFWLWSYLRSPAEQPTANRHVTH